jgi:hypothetical protein
VHQVCNALASKLQKLTAVIDWESLVCDRGYDSGLFVCSVHTDCDADHGLCGLGVKVTTRVPLVSRLSRRNHTSVRKYGNIFMMVLYSVQPGGYCMYRQV